ncbi:MAG: Resolvase domain protein [Planctomycetaceae bacterium]|nr:Resolvase domain protein [Planctomycetaceae bacterium]
MNRKPAPQARTTIRCAIYTGKSTEEGLQQEFNSLDAQRESAEAFIKSQAQEGWECLSNRYDDGGFTGGNMDRPAFRRLMADIERGEVDAVVIYKIDRLTRSLLDFARIMEVFEKHNISLVSVTQALNSTHSMGRLTLNILLSFAQFEREIIGERTRDKIAATRKKGKWTGGRPILGYDIDPKGSKLVVNELEAIRVRQIFDLYLQHQSLTATARDLGSRDWHSKAWVTKAGRTKGGQPFQKTMLHQLLTNVLYIGKVRHQEQVYPGEHTGIVEPSVFKKVQVQLQQNGRSGGTEVRNKHGALLKGLLHCTHCHSSMVHHYSQKNGRRYKYYICLSAQKLGWDTCAAPSLPAGEIEQFIIDQIRHIGQDPNLIRETLEKARLHVTERTGQLQAELAAVHRQRHRDEAELKKVAGAVDGDSSLARLADLQERLRIANERSTGILAELDQLQAEQIDETEVATALAEFDAVWQVLSPKEQARVLQLLIERVDYHGDTGDVTLTFHPTGLSALSETLEESAA